MTTTRKSAPQIGTKIGGSIAKGEFRRALRTCARWLETEASRPGTERQERIVRGMYLIVSMLEYRAIPSEMSPARRSRDSGQAVRERCSFCGKSREDAKHLVAGSGGYICDGCIPICSKLLRELERDRKKRPRSLTAL
jgi:hypothetical protein